LESKGPFLEEEVTTQTWHPDGEHIIIELYPRWWVMEDMLFCQFKMYDGDRILRCFLKLHRGSGHPSVFNADSSYLLAAITYSQQKMDFFFQKGERSLFDY